MVIFRRWAIPSLIHSPLYLAPIVVMFLENRKHIMLQRGYTVYMLCDGAFDTFPLFGLSST